MSTQGCRTFGHTYGNTTSDNTRKCIGCNKVQMKHNGTWIDAPKREIRRSKKTDEKQLTFDTLSGTI